MMKKKFNCFILALACMPLLFSCADLPEKTQALQEPPANSLYTLTLDQDSLYLLPKNEITADPSDSSVDGSENTVNGGCLVGDTDDPQPIRFTTVSEIRDKILKYSLTQEEINLLASFDRDDKGRIPIWNVSRACEPSLPSGVSYARGDLYGVGFRLILKTDDGKEGIYSSVDPAAYRETLGFERLLTDEQMRVYQTDDRNATVMENQGLYGLVRRYLYEISDDSVTYTVGEIYYDVEKNSTAPDSVYVFIETDYQCYYVEWYGLTERPSVEWLTSFGLAHTE